MMWLVLAIASAICESLKDVVGKSSLKANVDSYLVSWALIAFTMPVFIPTFIYAYIPLNSLNRTFWYSLLADTILSAISTVFYIKALAKADLSITVPLVSFSPFFLVFTSYWLLREIPKPLAFLGVLLVVAGAYILNQSQNNRGLLAPLKSLFTQQSSRLMLGVALCWGWTSAFDKLGVQNSSPLFFAASLYILTTVLLFPVLLWRWQSQQVGFQLRCNFLQLLLMGTLFAAAMIFQLEAVNQTLAVVAVSIKRTSLLWSVLWGHLFFLEAGFKQRLFGAAIMLLGAICVLI